MQLVTIARPYAKALFELATTQQNMICWEDFLHNAALIVLDRKIQNVLTDPNITTARVLQLFYLILGEDIDSLARGFLNLLVSYDRLALLPEIEKVFLEFKAEHEKTLKVKVVSAFALTQNMQEKIIIALNKRLQLQIKLDCYVDNSLLGGAIIYAGDLVFDGSGRKRLEQLLRYLEEGKG